MAAIWGEGSAIRPEVSVIVPALNSARTIRRCLQALADQRTTHDFEVVLVDSGSDRTSEIAAEVIASVRLLRLPRPSVAAAARNAGAKLARGDVLAFIDSDAYAPPDWIDRVVEAAEAGYDLVCGSIANANPDSRVGRAEQLLMFNEFLPGSTARPSWFALSGNMVMRKESFLRYGPFVEVRAAEDVAFSRTLIARGGSILFFPALVASHDNRTRMRPFLQNQFVLGRHTAMARRLVTLGPRSYYPLFVAALPAVPIAKLARIGMRLRRRNPRALRDFLREFPLLIAGVCWNWAGMLTGVLALAASTPQQNPSQGRGSTESSVGGLGALPPPSGWPDSKAPISGAAPTQGR